MSPASRFGRGLLWRLQTPGIAASYLYGTMHSADARVTSLAAPVIDALDTSRNLILEVKLHLAKQMQRHFYLDGPADLEQLLEPAQWQRLALVLEARGMHPQRVRSMQPWAVALSLQTPTLGQGEPLDLLLQRRAETQAKPVLALESVREQLAVFADLDLDQQRRLLLSTVHQCEQFPDMLEHLTSAYLARDLQRMQQLLAKQVALGDHEFNAAFMTRLLEDRNQRMLGRMLPRLRRGGAMVAVGALHLAGRSGLLNRLAGRGFSISCSY